MDASSDGSTPVVEITSSIILSFSDFLDILQNFLINSNEATFSEGFFNLSSTFFFQTL